MEENIKSLEERLEIVMKNEAITQVLNMRVPNDPYLISKDRMTEIETSIFLARAERNSEDMAIVANRMCKLHAEDFAKMVINDASMEMPNSFIRII